MRAWWSKTFISLWLYIHSKQLIHHLKAYFCLHHMIHVGLVSTSFSRKYDLKFIFFYFYFLNLNFSRIIDVILLKSVGRNGNILIEGTVSQNFDLGPSFYFISKNGKILVIFFNIIFLDFIKSELRRK